MDLDFEDTMPWLIGVGAVVLIGGALYGMVAMNVNSAIKKCTDAGYAAPEKSWRVQSCPADEDYASDSVAMVVGNVANSPTPILTDESTKYLRNSLAETNGKLDINIYSATPSGQRIKLDSVKARHAGNAGSFVKEASRTLDAVNKAIKTPPTESGVDYFNNIMAAARAATTSPSHKSPLVLVIGSGLSDSQPLNFSNGDLLHGDPADILNSLKKQSIISAGELNGVKIVWSGLGVVTTPQQPLDAKERRSLRNIYATIFQYMGADFVTDDTVMASDSITTDKTVKQIVVTGVSGGVVIYKLGENAIGFKPDTATIIDNQKANMALAGVTEQYQKCRTAEVTIEGYTAHPSDMSEQAMKDLSKKRADAVKNLLIQKGVNAASIMTLGRGPADFEGRVNETTDGKWDSVKAQANRVVVVKLDPKGVCNG